MKNATSNPAATMPDTVKDKLAAYIELTKPRLTLLVLVTTWVGYFLGSRESTLIPRAGGEAFTLIYTIAGVGLLAACVGALNQFLERDLDARMDRTRDRPLPSGRLTPGQVLVFGLICCGGGLALLALLVNMAAAGLGALTVGIYLFAYTPLKTRTTYNTLIGAIPGALPVVIGWTAATGRLEVGSGLIFALIFVWQLPHFWAIASLYREDYQSAGMKMLSVYDQGCGLMQRQYVIWSMTLVVASLLPVLFGVVGTAYAYGALPLGLIFVGFAIAPAIIRTRAAVRWLFLISLVYLPCLLGMMMLVKSGLVG